jgi:hypothetical protein
MTMTEILQSQLTDVFRMGLIAALIYTTLHNRAITGTIVPLLAGVLFVAVIIPVTLPADNPVPLAHSIGTGLVANLILLAAGWAIWTGITRLLRK